MRATFERAKSVTGSYDFRSGSSDRQSVTFHFSSWIFPWHRGVKMAIDQVRIRSLYAGLHRTVFRFGLLIAAAWLFAVFSYYLSMKTNADWFTRSGALMGLVGRSHLQARPFLPAGACDGAQGRPRISAQRNRASPRTAQTPCGPFVSRLFNRHRRYRDLRLWGS